MMEVKEMWEEEQEDEHTFNQDITFVLNTKTTCFLCLNNICATKNQFSGKSLENDEEELDQESDGCFPLRSICRYLSINVNDLFISGVGKCIADRDQLLETISNFSVKLCEECLAVATKLSELCMELELIQMKVDDCVKSFLESLEDSQMDIGRIHRFRQSLMGPVEEVHANLVQMLRKELKKKCDKRLNNVLPRVLISEKRRHLKRKIDPGVNSLPKHSGGMMVKSAPPHVPTKENNCSQSLNSTHIISSQTLLQNPVQSMEFGISSSEQMNSDEGNHYYPCIQILEVEEEDSLSAQLTPNAIISEEEKMAKQNILNIVQPPNYSSGNTKLVKRCATGVKSALPRLIFSSCRQKVQKKITPIPSYPTIISARTLSKTSPTTHPEIRIPQPIDAQNNYPLQSSSHGPSSNVVSVSIPRHKFRSTHKRPPRPYDTHHQRQQPLTNGEKECICTLCDPPLKLAGGGYGAAVRMKRHKLRYHIEIFLGPYKLPNVATTDFKVYCDHVFQVEVISTRKEMSEEGKPICYCHHCPNYYTNSPTLRFHLFDKHREIMSRKLVELQKSTSVEEITAITLPPFSFSPVPLLNCDLCGSAFSTTATLREHKKHVCKFGLQLKQNKFKEACEICGKIFYSGSRLIDHKKLHLQPCVITLDEQSETLETATVNVQTVVEIEAGPSSSKNVLGSHFEMLELGSADEVLENYTEYEYVVKTGNDNEDAEDFIVPEEDPLSM